MPRWFITRRGVPVLAAVEWLAHSSSDADAVDLASTIALLAQVIATRRGSGEPHPLGCARSLMVARDRSGCRLASTCPTIKRARTSPIHRATCTRTRLTQLHSVAQHGARTT